MRDYKQMQEVKKLREQAEAEGATPEDTRDEQEKYEKRGPGFRGWTEYIAEYYKWPIIIVGVIVIAEIVLLATTKEHCMIHDKLANTVTVDLPSQMIFNTQEELIAYKEKVAAEKAAHQVY